MEERRPNFLKITIIWILALMLDSSFKVGNHQACASSVEFVKRHGEKTYEDVLAPVLEIHTPEGAKSLKSSESSYNENRRVLTLGGGRHLPNNLEEDLILDHNFGDGVTNYVDPKGSAPSYADPNLLSKVMKQADKANFRYPIWTTYPPAGDENEINPFGLFPPEFHDLLNIPLHVYKNGSTYNPNRKHQNIPLVSAGYASTNIQGGQHKTKKKEEKNILPVVYRPKQMQILTKTISTPTPATTFPTRVITQTEISFQTKTIPTVRPPRPALIPKRTQPTQIPTRRYTRPPTKAPRLPFMKINTSSNPKRKDFYSTTQTITNIKNTNNWLQPYSNYPYTNLDPVRSRPGIPNFRYTKRPTPTTTTTTTTTTPTSTTTTPTTTTTTTTTTTDSSVDKLFTNYNYDEITDKVNINEKKNEKKNQLKPISSTYGKESYAEKSYYQTEPTLIYSNRVTSRPAKSENTENYGKFVPSKQFYIPNFEHQYGPPVYTSLPSTTLKPILQSLENYGEVLPPVTNTFTNFKFPPDEETTYIQNKDSPLRLQTNNHFNNYVTTERRELSSGHSGLYTTRSPNIKRPVSHEINPIRYGGINTKFNSNDPRLKVTRRRPQPFIRNNRPTPVPDNVINAAGMIDSGFKLPDEAGNLPHKNSLRISRPFQESPKQSILPQFRPNADRQEETFGFYSPGFAPFNKQRPLRPHRRTQIVKKKPSFLDNFNFFGRTPVNRRRGESSSSIHGNRITEEEKSKIKRNEEAAEYLLSHGPVPIHAKKVVVIGPFDRPPPGAPLIIPDKTPPKTSVHSNNSPWMLTPRQNFNRPLNQHQARTESTQSVKNIQNHSPILPNNDHNRSGLSKFQNNFNKKNNQPDISRNLNIPSSLYPPKEFQKQSVFNKEKELYLKQTNKIVDKRQPLSLGVVYGKPVNSNKVINGNIGFADVSARYDVNDFRNSKPKIPLQIKGLPPLIDNVTKEDKEAIIAAKIRFPSLSTIHRSGQQMIIPLPVPILTKNGQNQNRYRNRRPVAADRRIIVESNLDNQRLVKLNYKSQNKPNEPALFMTPPPLLQIIYSTNSNIVRPNYLSHSLSITELPNSLKPSTKISVNKPINIKVKKIAEQDSGSKNEEIPSKNNSTVKFNPYYSVDMSVFVENDVEPMQLLQPVYTNSISPQNSPITRSPSRPMRVTEFDPYVNVPRYIQKHQEPSSFVEPRIPKNSYDGWVAMGASLPDSVNPVVGYVKENTPDIKIIGPKKLTRVITAKPNIDVKSPRFNDVPSIGQIITGTKVKSSKDGSLVQYKTLLSIEAPDVVNSYLIPKTEN